MQQSSAFIAIGKIGRPHGLDGSVIVFPLGGTLEKLSVPLEIIIGDEEGAFTKTVTMAEISAMNQVFKCKLSTFDSPEAAEVLKGRFISITQENLSAHSGAAEFYHFELKGMRVVSVPDNNLIGEVIDVHNYPTTDAIEIKKENGQTFIIGLDPAIVRAIDRTTRTIAISLDLLEEIL
jgi:16S rRNA processing protein RimM